MSADKTIDIEVVTDHGPVHSMVRFWAAKVREQPAVRLTRENVIDALKDDPKMADAVEAIKKNVPKGSVVWMVAAESGTTQAGPLVTMTVRFG